MNEYVFISYSSKDSAIADTVCAGLSSRGIEYFRDVSGIGGAEYFVNVLSSKIVAAHAVLLIMTENSMFSPWVKWEIINARVEDKPILPYAAQGYMPLEKDFKLIGESQAVYKLNDVILSLERLFVPNPETPAGVMNLYFGSYVAQKCGKVVVSSDKKLFLYETDGHAHVLPSAPSNADGIVFISEIEIVCNDNVSGKMLRYNLNTAQTTELRVSGGKMTQIYRNPTTKERVLFFIDEREQLSVLSLNSFMKETICEEKTDCFYLHGESVRYRRISDGAIITFSHAKRSFPECLADESGKPLCCDSFCCAGSDLFYQRRTEVFRFSLENHTITPVVDKVMWFNVLGGRFYFVDSVNSDLFLLSGELRQKIEPKGKPFVFADFLVFEDCIFCRGGEFGKVARINLTDYSVTDVAEETVKIGGR